jgi:Circularly permutated YpsA SLOG family
MDKTPSQENSLNGLLPKKIISGGQTGVDRAALSAAMDEGLETGGYVPKGRLAEDGQVPLKFNLTETPQSEYHVRTILNVKESDATLILTYGKPSGGTRLTYAMALKNDKPVECIDLNEPEKDYFYKILKFLMANKPRILNIAGPRESNFPGIYQASYLVLKTVFKRLK